MPCNWKHSIWNFIWFHILASYSTARIPSILFIHPIQSLLVIHTHTSRIIFRRFFAYLALIIFSVMIFLFRSKKLHLYFCNCSMNKICFYSLHLGAANRYGFFIFFFSIFLCFNQSNCGTNIYQMRTIGS